MLFDERMLEELRNEVTSNIETVSRSGAYPSFDIISEKPAFAEGSRYIPDSSKADLSKKAPVSQQFDQICYDHVGASFWILKKLSTDNPYVKHASHIIASSCASTVPLFQISHKNNKKEKLVNDLTDLLSYPNMNEFGYSIIYKTVKSLANYGNAFWQVIKKLNGDIHSIYFLPANTLRVIPFINTENGQLEFCYTQTNIMTNKIDRVYFQEEIIHFKQPNPDSILYGVSEMVALFKDISFDEEAKNYIISWFQESFTGGQIFKMANSSKDVVKRNRQEMQEKYTGTSNAGRVMVLEGDMALVYDGNKVRDIDFSGLKSISRDTIYTCYGVPLSVAGVRAKEGSGNAEVISSEEQAFIRNTLNHYLKIIYDTINLKLFRFIMQTRDLTIKSGVTGMFNNKNSQNTVANASKYCGTSVNENRELVGLPPIQDPENSDYFDKPIIATNNGIAPFITVFDQLSNNIQASPETLLKGQVTPTVNISQEKGKIGLTNKVK